MTIDQTTVEIEVNEPGRSLRVIQTRSTNGESDGLSSKFGNMQPVLHLLMGVSSVNCITRLFDGAGLSLTFIRQARPPAHFEVHIHAFLKGTAGLAAFSLIVAAIVVLLL